MSDTKQLQKDFTEWFENLLDTIKLETFEYDQDIETRLSDESHLSELTTDQAIVILYLTTGLYEHLGFELSFMTKDLIKSEEVVINLLMGCLIGAYLNTSDILLAVKNNVAVLHESEEDYYIPLQQVMDIPTNIISESVPILFYYSSTLHKRINTPELVGLTMDVFEETDLEISQVLN
jgi:hypothetical protein